METDALKQYRELIGAHFGAIEAGAPAAMNGPVRRRAADALGNVRLPRRGDEGYEYTDLEAILSPDLGVNINRHSVPTDLGAVFKCGVPNISSLLGVTVNDVFRPTDTLLSRLPAGVTVKAFSKADGEDKAVIEKYYGTIAGCSKPEVALNTALAQDGVLVRIGAGVTLDRPIQLVNILEELAGPDGTPMPVLAVRRLLIVAERGSSADILVCDHDRAADGMSVTSRVNEIIVGENARLNCYELEEGSGKTSRLTETAARMERDSRLGLFSGTLKGGRTRNNFTVSIDGQGATLTIDGMVIADGDQIIDNSATVLHNVPECTSNQTF
ncbi:MAG: SufD family Fe-S cluster assembly protein, partial [Muribaculaceae bacterium]|nr:SufD family Fe-S cluster assembly protein [Muribaculaceae bacterium]